MNVLQLRNKRTRLLSYLWDIQNDNGFISDSEIRRLANDLNVSAVEMEGVISFYHFFHRKPVGKFTIYLNDSIVSRIKGYTDVKEALVKETGAEFGDVDPTGTFGLFETPCIGLSDQEPAALINFRPFNNLTPEKVEKIITGLRQRKDIDELCDEIGDNIRYTPGDKAVLLRDYKIGNALKKSLKLTPEEVIEQMKNSGLSGRGGAFFPTGLKWQFCASHQSYQKYVVCNADEGEPGTFKDRILINSYPELLLEGMILAGYAIGASKGIIYLRAEYFYLLHKLEDAIAKFYDIGLLGENILGHEDFDFDIRVQMGAGAYVCGEETGLLESMEGKRGEPRTKVYFPVEKGYLGKPTIINNVETFCAAARIFELGDEFYKSLGTEKTSGTKLLSISGHCTKPGIYEIEWGMTIREMLDLCGAEDPYFIQFSGPSGRSLSPADFDRKICWEDLICGGSVMIFNSKTDIFKILRNFSNFFINESCGICTPCRAGNFLIGKRMDKFRRGFADEEDIKEIINWSNIIKASSRCGLGKTSTNFLLDIIEKFPEVLNKMVKDNPYGRNKEFNVDAEVQDYYDFVKKTKNHHE